jgi:hypothetical protein
MKPVTKIKPHMLMFQNDEEHNNYEDGNTGGGVPN